MILNIIVSKKKEFFQFLNIFIRKSLKKTLSYRKNAYKVRSLFFKLEKNENN